MTPTDDDRKAAREWADGRVFAEHLDHYFIAEIAYAAGLAAGRAQERERCAWCAKNIADENPNCLRVADFVANVIRDKILRGDGPGH